MKEILRLKTHIRTALSAYSDDASKAIEMMNEENKTLKTKVSVLQNVTVSASKPLQNATSGFGTGLTYSCTSPSTVTIPNITFDAEYWKKLKTTVDSALEPYVGRQ
jgi:hypothetical protein